MTAKSKSWGFESEFTRKIRAQQLEQPAIESCAVCDITAPTRSAKAGINWFAKHAKSRAHKRAVREQTDE